MTTNNQQVNNVIQSNMERTHVFSKKNSLPYVPTTEYCDNLLPDKLRVFSSIYVSKLTHNVIINLYIPVDTFRNVIRSRQHPTL